MTVTVLFFAHARDRAGRASARLTLPEGCLLEDALAAVVREHPALAPSRPHLAVAMNGRLVRPGTPVVDGAELALLPPVSGG